MASSSLLGIDIEDGLTPAADCNEPVGSDGIVEQGAMVRVDALSAEVRLARFSDDGVPLRPIALTPDSTWVIVPVDAPGAPDGAPPYRVLVAGSAAVSVCS